jgi:hypothetical protein
VLQQDGHAEKIQRQIELGFEILLDAHSGLRQYENGHGEQGQAGVQDRLSCHLDLTGVDQMVRVVGGRKVPAFPRHCRQNWDSQHQK